MKQVIVPISPELTRNRGTCMINRLRMLGVPGIIVQGNTVRIGADTYEFRDSTPPLGGTAGRIWVFNGTGGAADAVISRANFILAVNGGGTAAQVTRTSVTNPTAATNTELVTAVAGVTLGDIIVYSAAAIGGAAAASASALVTAETLTTVTDIWDLGTMYAGVATAVGNTARAVVTVNADEITKGTLQVEFPFTPVTCMVVDRSRAHNEVVTIVGNAVSVVLTGGVSPNIQPADVLDVIAFG